MGGSTLWTWNYWAQQIIVLSLWLFLLSAVWKEFRAWRTAAHKDTGLNENDGFRT